MQINAKTPDSLGQITPTLKKDTENSPKGESSPGKSQALKEGVLKGEGSIKDLMGNSKVIGELDVETNYLRQSGQNFSEEMHLKTVF